MPDPQTILRPTHYYHVYNHAVGKENLFERDADYIYFLKKLKEHVVPVSEVMSYCLLPNHFHLIIRVKTHEDVENFLRQRLGIEKFDKAKNSNEYFLSDQISKIFSNFFNTYAKHYNFWKGRTGTLFKRNFRRKDIETTAYLNRLICYVHQNPVTAGFAQSLEHWKYSSYAALISTHPTLIPREEIISLFGDLDNLKYCHSRYEEIDIG
jgi:putative transposase